MLINSVLWERESTKLALKFNGSVLYVVAGVIAKLANEKKSPVGYKLFARACIKYGKPNIEVEKYTEILKYLKVVLSSCSL